MDNNRKVVPYRLKQARISRGFSMAELAEFVDVCKQAISQYERGKTSPSNFVLNNISSVLKYPISYFYKPMPIKEMDDSPIFFRSKKTTRIKDRDASKEKISIFREITSYLENYVDFPQVKFPEVEYLDIGLNFIDNDMIEEYANELRNCWGLGSGPIDNLMNHVQKNGFMVSKMMLRLNKIDAFSVWHNNRPFIFLSSDKCSNVKTRFDISHELGHLLMHIDHFNDSDVTKGELYNKLEDEANRFAGAFLMPKDTFSRDVFSSSIDHFIQLKSKWKTSISSMIYRCETLGILSQNQIKYLKDQMTQRVYWRKEPLDNVMPIEKPYTHKQSIMLLLDNNIVNPYDIIESIGCYGPEIEEYCFLDKGVLDVQTESNVVDLKSKYYEFKYS